VETLRVKVRVERIRCGGGLIGRTQRVSRRVFPGVAIPLPDPEKWSSVFAGRDNSD
jgi:hypothetical protein